LHPPFTDLRGATSAHPPAMESMVVWEGATLRGATVSVRASARRRPWRLAPALQKALRCGARRRGRSHQRSAARARDGAFGAAAGRDGHRLNSVTAGSPAGEQNIRYRVRRPSGRRTNSRHGRRLTITHVLFRSVATTATGRPAGMLPENDPWILLYFEPGNGIEVILERHINIHSI
jgi:hypothetical protein